MTENDYEVPVTTPILLLLVFCSLVFVLLVISLVSVNFVITSKVLRVRAAKKNLTFLRGFLGFLRKRKKRTGTSTLASRKFAKSVPTSPRANNVEMVY